jgi:hypothetical protein
VDQSLTSQFDHKISRLYRPLGTGSQSDLDDDDDDTIPDTQLLPMHNNHGASHTPKRSNRKSIRLADVWDEREELFASPDSDDDDELEAEGAVAGHPTRRVDEGQRLPEIYVTSS